VPDVLSGLREGGLDAGHLLGQGQDGVLPALLPGRRRLRRGALLQADLVTVDVDRLPVHHLERNLVDVNRVGVHGHVVDLPDLGRADGRVGGDGVHPHLGHGVPGAGAVPLGGSGVHALSNRAEQRGGRAAVVAVLQQGEPSGHGGGRQRGDRGQPEVPRRSRGVGLGGGDHPELQHHPGGGGVGRLEVGSGDAAAVGLIRPHVAERVRAGRDPGEVDDQVGALGRDHQQPVAVLGGEVDRGGQQAALVADLPHGHAGEVAEVEDQEARLAAVEHPEAVAPAFDLLVGPGAAVHDERVSEELGIPDRWGVRVGDVGAGLVVEECAGVGVEQRAVRIERAILDRERNVAAVARPGGAVLRCRAGQDGRLTGARVDDLAVAAGAAPQEEESGRAGVHVQPGHPERVVVVPDRRGPVLVRILGDGEARAPGDAEPARGPAGEEVVPRARAGVAAEVGGRGQVPGLRVPVALVADADRPVHVGDHRHGPPVAGVLRGRVEVGIRRGGGHVGAPGQVGLRVGALAAQLAGIRPVERRVHREEVRQVVAIGVHELVDPLDPDRGADLGVDGEGRSVEQPLQGLTLAVSGDRPVAPHGGLRTARGQHLLVELPDGDLVVVDVAPAGHDAARPRHDGRNEQRSGELLDLGRIQRSAGQRNPERH